MHELHHTEHNATLIEAWRRLSEHNRVAREILNGLVSEDIDIYECANEAFSSYANSYTWLNRNIFRIYLSSGDTAEHLDLHFDYTLNSGQLVYRLETLSDGVDIRVDYGSPLYLYATMATDEFGDFTH